MNFFMRFLKGTFLRTHGILALSAKAAASEKINSSDLSPEIKAAAVEAVNAAIDQLEEDLQKELS